MYTIISRAALISLLASVSLISARPSYNIPKRAAAIPPANLTELTCTPAESGGSASEYPALNASACLHSLQAFISNHSKPATAKNQILTFTSNFTEARNSPLTSVISPMETVAPGESASNGGLCGVSFALYGTALTHPDVQVSLSALTNATTTVINACTGKSGPGNGGVVVLTTPTGAQIDVAVYRPV